jgi:hypothetical protein
VIPLLLMLAASSEVPRSAADAERSFARDAQTEGQWTAFRNWADDEAVMFLPQPTKAQAWLKDRKDPPNSVMWWAADSFVSCDGGHAANTGPWVRGWAKANGYFSTIWARQPSGGWKWLVDRGDALTSPRAAGERPRVTHASCRGRPTTVAAVRYRDGDTGEGQSNDRTLAWRWHVAPDGGQSLDVWLWDGRRMKQVIADRTVAG